MARCGCGVGCNCVVQSGSDCVSVTGNGSIRLPYIVDVVISNAPGQLLQCTSAGLFVDQNAIPIAVNATNGVQGDGTVGTPLEAQYSTDADNQAQAGTDGHIFVPFPTINVADPVTGDGSPGSPLTVFFSTDLGNNATTGTDGGIFVPTGAATVATAGCVTGDGSGGSPIDLDIFSDGGIQCGGSGLELNLDGTNGGTSGLNVSASGVRVAESPTGALQRTPTGLTQLGPYIQNAWVGLSDTLSANEWLISAIGVAPTSTVTDLPAAYGTWDVANGRFVFAVEGMYAITCSILLPQNLGLRGWQLEAQRNNTNLADGNFSTALTDTNIIRGFATAQQRVSVTFMLQFAAGNTCRPLWRVWRTDANGTFQTFDTTWSATYLGELR